MDGGITRGEEVTETPAAARAQKEPRTQKAFLMSGVVVLVAVYLSAVSIISAGVFQVFDAPLLVHASLTAMKAFLVPLAVFVCLTALIAIYTTWAVLLRRVLWWIMDFPIALRSALVPDRH